MSNIYDGAFLTKMKAPLKILEMVLNTSLYRAVNDQ